MVAEQQPHSGQGGEGTVLQVLVPLRLGGQREVDPATSCSDLISRRSLPHSLPTALVTGSPMCAAHSRLGAFASAVPAAKNGFF